MRPENARERDYPNSGTLSGRGTATIKEDYWVTGSPVHSLVAIALGLYRTQDSGPADQSVKFKRVYRIDPGELC